MADILAEIVRKKAPTLELNGLNQLYQMVMHDQRPSFVHGIYLFVKHEDN